MVRFASFVGLASSTYKLITTFLRQYCKEEVNKLSDWLKYFIHQKIGNFIRAVLQCIPD